MTRIATVSEWVRRWWIPLSIAGLAVLGVVLKVLLKPVAGQAADKAAKALSDASTQAQKELTDLQTKMASRQAELDRIDTIPDEQERMKALAEYDDRRETGQL